MQKSYEIFAPDDIEIEYVYFSRKSIRQVLMDIYTIVKILN